MTVLREDLATSTDRSLHPEQHNEVNRQMNDLQEGMDQPGGTPVLDPAGKIKQVQLPALPLIAEVHEVGSQAAQLALNSRPEGTVAIRSDIRKTYMRNSGTAGTMADWTELQNPAGVVTSVNGQIGVVNLTKADAGLANVDNTSDVNKPVSTAQQTAIDTAGAGKQPLDPDLTAIAALTPANNDIVQRKAGAWTNRTPAQVRTDMGAGAVNGLATLDGAGKVPASQIPAIIGPDLTDIEALTPAVSDLLQSKAGHWTNRTPAQVASDLGAGAANGLATLDGTGKIPAGQLPAPAPLDPDLVTIAALTPPDNDVLQRKAGAWTGRAPAQLAVDLGAAGPQLSGIATLDAAGKVPTAQLPALAVVAEVHEVADQAAQLALNARPEGTVAIRSDIRKTYMRNSGTAGTMADWSELLTPTDVVTSVNGEFGVITLTKSHVGLGNVDNTSDANKPVSTATQNALTSLGATLQPLDTDLTAIAALTPAANDVLQSKAGQWVNRTPAQLAADLGAAGPQFNGIATLDGTGKVPSTQLPASIALPPDLIDIGNLTPADDDLIQRKSGAWVTRNPAQLSLDLGAAGPQNNGIATLDGTGKVPAAQLPPATALDQDLVDIGNLTPADDDFVQRKGGTWANRTVAQVKADLGVTAGGGGGGFVSSYKWGVGD